MILKVIEFQYKYIMLLSSPNKFHFQASTVYNAGFQASSQASFQCWKLYILSPFYWVAADKSKDIVVETKVHF